MNQKIGVLLLLTMVANAAQGAENISIGDFSTGSLQDWEAQSFKGQTQYRLIDQGGVKVLKAESVTSASGLFKEQRIDLTRTPFLNWRWRIENRLGKLDEQSKRGDDYVVSVYVIVSGGLTFWRKKAINYVWARSSPKGKIWPNAFAGDHVMIMALRSSGDVVPTWYGEIVMFLTT